MAVLVVGVNISASISLYFDALGQMNRKIKIIQYNTIEYDHLIGAQAVIFVRELFEEQIRKWINWCKLLEIPHYYYTDDNFIELAGEDKRYSYWANVDQIKDILMNEKLKENFRPNF